MTESGQLGVRRSRSVRVAAGLGVTALGVAVVAGCASRGGGDAKKLGDGTPTGAIQAAAQQMLSSKSVHVHAVMASDGMTETLDGGLVFTPTFKGALTMTVGGAQVPAPTPDPNAPGGGSADAFTAMPTALVFDGKTLYEKLPAAAGLGLPSGKSWLATPMDGAGGGAKMSPFGSLDMTDPQKLVAKALATGKFTLGVPKTVGGLSTTDYAGVFNDTGNPVHVDLFLDPTGLPVEVKVSEGKSADGSITPKDLDVRFTAWGTPVSVAVPPADQVASIEDMMKNVPTGLPSGYPTAASGAMPTDLYPTGPIIVPGTGPTTCVVQTIPAAPSGVPAPPKGQPTAVTFCGPVDLVKP